MLRFGTAGIPLCAKGTGTADGIKAVKELGLDAMELEFVHSVNISEEGAPKVKAAAEENGVALTCHGQYYINLNAEETAKLEASKKRLLNAARMASMCGAASVAFHPGFYMKSTKEDAYKKVKAAIAEVAEKLKQENNKIWLSPETTGKRSQFGTLNEILQLSQELERVQPCIDYAHLRARDGTNSAKEFAKVLEEVEKALGKEALKRMHIQFSGVNFSEKGELNHLPLKDCDINYEGIAKTWKDFKIGGIAISESPNIEKDALLMKKAYND